MLHSGLSTSCIAAGVKMVSPGSRLTLPAPFRMAPSCTAEMPLRLLRMEPASLRLSFASTNLRGGAKSRLVKVPDLRRRWLRHAVLARPGVCAGRRETYGLGNAGISSKALTNGEWAGTVIW